MIFKKTNTELIDAIHEALRTGGSVRIGNEPMYIAYETDNTKPYDYIEVYYDFNDQLVLRVAVVGTITSVATILDAALKAL